MKTQKSFGTQMGLWLFRGLALLFLLPVIHTVLGSLMDAAQIEKGGLQWLPTLPSLGQYVSLIIFKAPYGKFFINSVLITGSVLLFQGTLATLAAYGFAKFSFKGQNIMFSVYVLMLLMPFQVTFVPNMLMFDKLQKLLRIQILDTHWAIILPGAFSVFGVYLMTQFIRNLPDEMIEAARVEGASEWYVFWHIVLPNVKPALFSMLFLLFVDYWNLIEQAVLYLNTPAKQPLSVFLESIYYQDASVFYAGAIFYIMPAIYIFIKCERYLKEGIGDGGHR